MLSMGIDIGSLSTKAIIMQNNNILGWNVDFTGADPVDTAQRVSENTLRESRLALDDINCIAATGYGRVNVPFANFTITEISCHAKGNHYHFPGVRTILDMGGQDCKAIKCDENGELVNFVMNDKCAAGTGRHLERTARALGMSLDEIGPASLEIIDGPCDISSTCAVYAEMAIKNCLREGRNKNDILAGAIDAVTERVMSLMESVGIEKEVCISGGVAKNIGVVKRLEKKLGFMVRIAPEPQIVGAIGAALFAQQNIQ